MLGLGALSRGCSDQMSPFLPELLPFLLASVNGTIGTQECPPELRCVSAWVIGRYSYFWFDTELQDEKTTNDQKEIMASLLTAMLQSPPKFQSAACAALCAIFENCASVPSGRCVCVPRTTRHLFCCFSFPDYYCYYYLIVVRLCKIFYFIYVYIRPDEESINILNIFLVDILQQVQAAFRVYGVKNTLILCDTLATLCDALGECSLQSAEG
jgi:hypothetical protein